MYYVVTGATGCLGLNLTKRLVSEGHRVIALGRNQQLGAVIKQMGAEFISIDLTHLNELKKITSKADVLFHCAALSSPWGRYRDFYQANVLGTQHIIKSTPESCRLIHISSPSIYFNFKEKLNINEYDTLPSSSANHYIKTKLLAESLIDKAFNEENLNVVTIRPRAIFGPYDRAILPRLLQAERNGTLPVIGSGKNIIDITYVDNVIESMILAANASEHVRGKKYNITNDQPQSLISIIESLYSALDKPLNVKYIPYRLAKRIAGILEHIHRLPFMREPKLTRYSCGVLALSQTLNIDAAKKELGYKPVISIEEGLQRYAQWYQAQ